jgi:hypothetical protein
MDNFLIIEKFNPNDLNKQLFKKMLEEKSPERLRPTRLNNLPAIDKVTYELSSNRCAVKQANKVETEKKIANSLSKDYIVIPKRFVNLKLPMLKRNQTDMSPLRAIACKEGNRSGSSHIPQVKLDRPLNILKKKIIIKKADSIEMEKGSYVVRSNVFILSLLSNRNIRLLRLSKSAYYVERSGLKITKSYLQIFSLKLAQITID